MCGSPGSRGAGVLVGVNVGVFVGVAVLVGVGVKVTETAAVAVGDWRSVCEASGLAVLSVGTLRVGDVRPAAETISSVGVAGTRVIVGLGFSCGIVAVGATTVGLGSNGTTSTKAASTSAKRGD